MVQIIEGGIMTSFNLGSVQNVLSAPFRVVNTTLLGIRKTPIMVKGINLEPPIIFLIVRIANGNDERELLEVHGIHMHSKKVIVAWSHIFNTLPLLVKSLGIITFE